MDSKSLADMYRPGLSDEAAWHLAKVFRDSAAPDVAASYLESLYEQDVSGLLAEIHTPTLCFLIGVDAVAYVLAAAGSVLDAATGVCVGCKVYLLALRVQRVRA